MQVAPRLPAPRPPRSPRARNGPLIHLSRATLRAGLAALGLAVAACGGAGDAGSPTPPPGSSSARKAQAPPAARGPAPSPPSDREQLAALLTRRARSLDRGDGAAYAATATGAQRSRDRRAARRSRGLGVGDVGLTASTLRLTPRRAVMGVRSQYRVRGVAGRFTSDRPLVAVRTTRGWRVRSEGGARERHPWEIGPYARHRTRHFVVLAPAGLGPDGLPAALEAGYRSMRGVLPAARLRRRYLVVVAGSARAADRLTSGIRGVETLAAITDSEVRERGPARRADGVLSQRLLVVGPVFGALGPDARTRIVTHELTHAALAGVTSGRTPSWLVEGIALYVSGDRRVGEAAARLGAGAGRLPTLGRLTRPDGIARLAGDRQGESYAYASAAAYYLTGRFGERAYLRLYEAFNSERITGAAGESRTVDRALRSTLGISLRRLDRDLRRWLRTAS